MQPIRHANVTATIVTILLASSIEEEACANFTTIKSFEPLTNSIGAHVWQGNMVFMNSMNIPEHMTKLDDPIDGA